MKTKNLLAAAAILLSVSFVSADEYGVQLGYTPRDLNVVYDAYRMFPGDVRGREAYIADHGGLVESAAERTFPRKHDGGGETIVNHQLREQFIWSNRK